jgi:hypothetical protein
VIQSKQARDLQRRLQRAEKVEELVGIAGLVGFACGMVIGFAFGWFL